MKIQGSAQATRASFSVLIFSPKLRCATAFQKTVNVQFSKNLSIERRWLVRRTTACYSFLKFRDRHGQGCVVSFFKQISELLEAQVKRYHDYVHTREFSTRPRRRFNFIRIHHRIPCVDRVKITHFQTVWVVQTGYRQVVREAHRFDGNCRFYDAIPANRSKMDLPIRRHHAFKHGLPINVPTDEDCVCIARDGEQKWLRTQTCQAHMRTDVIQCSGPDKVQERIFGDFEKAMGLHTSRFAFCSSFRHFGKKVAQIS